MSRHNTRREFLRLSGGLAIGVAAALGRSGSALAQELATLRATHFGGPYQSLREIIAQPFEQAKMGRVVYEVETGPTTVAKLQAQRDEPPFDVVMISRSFALRALNSGLLEKMNPAEIPEMASLKPGSAAPSGSGVALMLDAMQLMVDTKQVKEPLTSWLDLWRPELKGKIMLPAAFNGGATIPFIGCIARAVGGDEKSEAAVNEAFARLKALKPSVRGFFTDGNQPTDVIQRGDIAVAAQFAIRIANITKSTPHIVSVTPKEGACAVPYDLCIVAGAKQPKLAKTYINFALGEAVQGKLVQNLLATPSRGNVPISPELRPMVISDPSKIWFMDEEYTAARQREWLDRYTREVQS
jgi:putative spermidine/putrescine transport system substrate-binding protein